MICFTVSSLLFQISFTPTVSAFPSLKRKLHSKELKNASSITAKTNPAQHILKILVVAKILLRSRETRRDRCAERQQMPHAYVYMYLVKACCIISGRVNVFIVSAYEIYLCATNTMHARTSFDGHNGTVGCRLSMNKRCDFPCHFDLSVMKNGRK